VSNDSELIQKRQEVKAEILVLKEQIPSARIFDQLSRMFKRNSLEYWLSGVVLLNLIILSPWGIIGLVLKEFDRPRIVLIETLIAAETIVLGFVIAHIAVDAILNDVADRIVEKIKNVDDLTKLLLWLKQTWSLRSVLTVAFPFWVVWVILSVGGMSSISQQFVGFGLSVTVIFCGSLVGMVVYIYLWTCLLIYNLKIYQYEMNVFSPADSEIISSISEMLARSIYTLAGLFAIITLIATSSLVDQLARAILGIPLLVFGWAVIIAQFLLTRSTLSTITNREKWITLNRLREKINALEATGDLSDKDTAERLFRLADIHKQIMASKTNTLDLKSVSTLFSQLMLPLLGLLLGNLDKVLKLLNK
jgi:hypothetical protein